VVSAKNLFKGDCDFKYGITNVENLPAPSLPEVVFAGRSNVGKSSLLNSLTKRKNLARTSKTPGCTQQLNFFLLDRRINLVDIPGYGYARASKKEVKGWNDLITNYLKGRPNLKRVFLLIDSRHGIKKNDEEIMLILDEAAVSYQVVLTKTDKQSEKNIEIIKKNIQEMGVRHPALYPEIIQTSSRTSSGVEDVRNAIAEFVK